MFVQNARLIFECKGASAVTNKSVDLPALVKAIQHQSSS